MQTIVLVGRPNVGKSTLFNRLTKSKEALVADMPGLTRDRHYKIAKHGKRNYLLVDTGGFEPLIENGIMHEMAKQTEEAIAEADVVLFLVDGRHGMTPQDKIIATKLRAAEKLVYVGVNKVEGMDKNIALSDFYALGLPNLYALSGTHGDGVFDLLNAILKNSANIPEEAVDTGTVFAVVGRPNVGKSTLVNAMLGSERVIAFNEAGTTRDSINISFTRNEHKYTIIDTAGIRRKGKVSDKIEKFSVLKALQSINAAHVVVLVLDAHLDIAEQDATIVGYALEAGKSIVVAINKWDGLDNTQKQTIKDDLARKLYFLDFARFTYLSALKKKGIPELFSLIDEAYNAAFIKLPTPKVTRSSKKAAANL
jgi:GTPase